MKLSKYVWTLLIASTLIAMSLLVLSISKKSVYIFGEVEVSQFGFQLEEKEGIENSLSLNNYDYDISECKVSGFEKARFRKLSLYHEGLDSNFLFSDTIVFQNLEDEKSSITLKNALPNELYLPKKSSIIIKQEAYESSRFWLKLFDYKQIQSFSYESLDESELKLKNATCPLPEEFEGVDLLLAPSKLSTFLIEPRDNSIELRFKKSKDTKIIERRPFRVSGLNFHEELDNRPYSTVIKGKITIDEMDKQIEFGKNKLIRFKDQAEFTITDLEISSHDVKVSFEGEISEMQIGFSGNRYIPSWLQYLYSNNYLIIVFNSYMVIISLFISLYKTFSKS